MTITSGAPHTIGLLIGNPEDQRLLADFLRASGYIVQAGNPLQTLADIAAVSLIVADQRAARVHRKDLLALKERSAETFLPVVIVLDRQANSVPWLLVGYDDVLRQPLNKAELAARLSVFLRLREQSIAQHQIQLELRKLSAHLQTAREEERAAIARELHDDLAQILLSAKIDVGLLAQVVSENRSDISVVGETVLQGLGQFAHSIDDSIRAIRSLVAQLRPDVLEEVGLEAAMEWQAREFQKRTGVACQFNSNVEKFIVDRERSVALYRVLQEALTNIARHAEATRVEVQLTAEMNQLRLEVRDNGCGISSEDMLKVEHFGIRGMRERIALLGGELAIQGTPGQGTVIDVRVPLNR